MDKQALEALVKDTQSLLDLVGPAVDAQKKLAALEPEYLDLKKQAAKVKADTREAATKAADYLVERGALQPSKTAEFIDHLAAHPEQIFDVMRKHAENLSVQEVGSPSDKLATTEGLDPIARFCQS